SVRELRLRARRQKGMTHRTHPRLIAALAALSLTALAACGGSDDPAAAGDTVAAPVTAPAATPTSQAGGEVPLRPPQPIQYTGDRPAGRADLADRGGGAAGPAGADPVHRGLGDWGQRDVGGRSHRAGERQPDGD